MFMEPIVIGFSTFISLALFIGALKAWRLSSATWAREEIFAVRADLFDAAMGKRAFNDPVYRELESIINGLLRWLDDVNGIFILSILLRRHKFADRNSDIIIEGTSLINTFDVQRAMLRIRKTMIQHIWFGSLSGFFLINLLWLSDKMNKFFKIIISYSKKMASDEFARNEINHWRHVPIKFSLATSPTFK